ncbi:hypothetical protein V9T40_010682 [Parthenolecanium corni]|uniref:Uncharacterized protein n=1 Tax=Parthenolecanium corni TaxID=536013 RepID=A0AAN9XXE9_9HEMI
MAFRFNVFFVSVSLLFVINLSSAFAGDFRLPVVRSAEISETEILSADSSLVKLSLSLDGENLDSHSRFRLALQPAEVAGAECLSDALLPEFVVEFANRSSVVARVILNASEFKITRPEHLALCVLLRNSSTEDSHKWLNLGKSVVFRTRPANSVSETVPVKAVALPQAA